MVLDLIGLDIRHSYKNLCICEQYNLVHLHFLVKFQLCLLFVFLDIALSASFQYAKAVCFQCPCTLIQSLGLARAGPLRYLTPK